jgi:DNA-binding CsgD family transcriptional regulator
MSLSKYVLTLNDELVRSLRELADWEQSTELVMASELVRMALEKAQPAREQRRIIASLTEREREVAALLIQGNTRQVISEQLYIAPETVKTHLRNIRRKLGLKTIKEIPMFLNDFLAGTPKKIP